MLEILSWGHWGAMEGFSRRGGAVLVGVLEFLTLTLGKRSVVCQCGSRRWQGGPCRQVWGGLDEGGAAGRESSGWGSRRQALPSPGVQI